MKFTKDLECKVRKRLDTLGKEDTPVTKTDMWYYTIWGPAIEAGTFIDPWNGSPFYEDPPTKGLKASNRVLITATNIGIRNIS